MNPNPQSQVRMEEGNIAREPERSGPSNEQRQERENPAVWIQSYLGFVPTSKNLKFIDDNRLLFLSAKTEVIDPDAQSYPQMLHMNFCPHFTLFSLTTLLLLGCTAYYIVAVIKGLNKNTFLQVQGSTLYELGMNNARMVYQGEVYRLVVSLFLHVNLEQLFSTMVILPVILPYFQYTFGNIRIGIAMVASGIVASMFSDITMVDQGQTMLKAGLNTCLMAVIGVGFGYLLVNWPSFRIMGPVFKFKVIVTLLLSFIFILVFTEAATQPDHSAHFGGLLAGILFSGMMPSIQTNTRQLMLRIILTILFWLMLLSTFLFFFLLPQTSYSF